MEKYLQEIEQEVEFLLEQYEKKGKFNSMVVLDAIEIINRNVQKIREAKDKYYI